MKLLGEYTTKHAERYEPDDEEQAVYRPPVINQNFIELLGTIQVITDFITTETVNLYQSIFTFLNNRFMYVDYDILEQEDVISPRKKARKNFGLFVLSSPSVLSLLAVLATGIIILSIAVSGFYLGKNLEPPVNILVIGGAWFGAWKLSKSWTKIYQAFEVRVENSLKDLQTPLPHPENSPFRGVDQSTTVNISTSQQFYTNFGILEKGMQSPKNKEPEPVVKETLDPWVKLHLVYKDEEGKQEYLFSFENQKKIGARYTIEELKRLYSAAKNRGDEYEQKIKVIVDKAEKLIAKELKEIADNRTAGNYSDYFSPSFVVNPNNELEYLVGQKEKVFQYLNELKKGEKPKIENFNISTQERYFELE